MKKYMLAHNFLASEIKEFSVKEISSKIKEILEDNIGLVRIKGEISGLKIATSGHVYFNLKDNFALLGCICWKNLFSKIKFNLNDGLEIVVTGRITSYPGQSRYQLSVENIEPSGIGAIMQILNERKERLIKEGLFDQKHKKPIPFMPDRIGVITSLTGVVIRDILHRISDRCPTNVMIWPSMVQGDLAAKQIVQGLEGFNKLDTDKIPGVIIIARGGGSIEDLWCFNEEEVVRAIFASKIPVISAVGHETDYTLADLVADMRAPTPTAAAEFITPVVTNLKYTLIELFSQLTRNIKEFLHQQTQILSHHGKIIKYSLNYIDLVEQKLDEMGFKLLDSLPNMLKFKTINLERFSAKILQPDRILEFNFLKLRHQEKYLMQVINNFIAILNNKLAIKIATLQALDYQNILKRGYAIVEDQAGKFLTSSAHARQYDKFSIRFWDGKIFVKKD